MKVQRIYYVLGILLCVLVTGCNVEFGNKKGVEGDGNVGIIKTMTQNKKTKIDTYGIDGKMIGTKTFSYGCVGNFGFGSSQVVDGIDYEIALGNDYDKDYGAVVGFDINDDSDLKIDFDRVNITGVNATKNYVYVISNLNAITYIDRYNIQNKKIESFEWNDNSAVFFSVSEDEMVYFCDSDCKLYGLEFDERKAFEICDLRDFCGKDVAVNYMCAVKGMIYLSTPSINLIAVNADSKEVKKINLDIKCGGQLLYQDNCLYISEADPVSGLDDGAILKYDVSKGKIQTKWNFDCDIYQFDMDSNNIYILSRKESKLYGYRTSGERIELLYASDIAVEDGYKLSGFWCLK